MVSIKTDKHLNNLKLYLHSRLTNIELIEVVSLFAWVKKLNFYSVSVTTIVGVDELLYTPYVMQPRNPTKSKTELTVVKQPLKVIQKAHSCDVKQTKLMFLKLH